jgi:hypothetical protein
LRELAAVYLPDGQFGDESGKPCARAAPQPGQFAATANRPDSGVLIALRFELA